jgi:hypothetical protein
VGVVHSLESNAIFLTLEVGVRDELLDSCQRRKRGRTRQYTIAKVPLNTKLTVKKLFEERSLFKTRFKHCGGEQREAKKEETRRGVTL